MSLKSSLKKVIIAHQEGKQDLFLEGVREIIVAERRRGHTKVADELEQSLRDATQATLVQQPMRQLLPEFAANTLKVPVSKGDNLPLVDVRYPKFGYDELILARPVCERVEKIVHENQARAKLSKFNLDPISRVLFYGPPGCGKTLTAHVLSGVLNWPLLYTRFDSVISSYLGETSVNLRRVFEFAERGPCILFFDEFDAVGKRREDSGDVGELKRVVNTFLQMMDNFQGDGIILAATNHEQLLDRALWRRFDEVVRFEHPVTNEIESLLRLRLSGIRLHDFATSDVTDEFEGLSHSDITRICISAIKQMVLSDRPALTERGLLNALKSFQTNRVTA